MKKVLIIVFLNTFLLVDFAFAQPIPNVPLDGPLPAAQGQIPPVPNNPGQVVNQIPVPPVDGPLTAPGGLPNPPTDGALTAPGGLPVPDTTGALTAPNVYGQPNNTQPITATGSFLNISLPANHGLPGNDGLKPMLQSLLQNALYFVGLIGILGLLYASIQLWLSHGKADSIGSAMANIFNIILGLAIVLLAWTGVTVVLRFLGF